jgi:hypothetical protein
MPTRTHSVVIVLLVGILSGCSNSPSSKPSEEKAQHAKDTSNPAKNMPSGSEAEARSVLKAALDSWAFGDPIEKFEKAHPGVSFFDTNWITKKRLGRYEIGNVRKDGITFEFLVTLTFREDSGDVTKSNDYHVTKDADGWVITAGGR